MKKMIKKFHQVTSREFYFRNCPCVFFCNIGYGLIPTFEIGELTEDQNEFFLSRFSSSKYEDMQL